MTHTKHFSASARAYAGSMLELADEAGTAESLGSELEGIGQVFAENPAFSQFLADPAFGAEQRGRTVKAIFGGRVSPLLMNVIGVLNSKAKLGLLGEIAEAYNALLDERLGKVEVDVTVARPLDAAGLEEVRQLVNRALKKDAVIHQYVDESIIGGLVLKVGDQMIDGSVKTQLEQIKRKLLASRNN